MSSIVRDSVPCFPKEDLIQLHVLCGLLGPLYGWMLRNSKSQFPNWRRAKMRFCISAKEEKLIASPGQLQVTGH